MLTYLKMDSLVNVDLYRYGLQFSSVWAEQYLSSYRNALYSLLFSIFLVGGSLIVYDDFGREGDSFSRWLGVLLGVSPLVLDLLSWYFILQVDGVVNGTLYQYGLQFSPVWAEAYWAIMRSVLVLVGVAGALSLPLTYLAWWTTKDKSPDN